MSWRSHRRSASFRGVPFYVTDTELSGGRRTVVVEFPQRDQPNNQDLGRKARSFPITGFVIGDDYMVVRDNLQKALEEGGEGVLIHPSYGLLAVNVVDYRVRESKDKLGMAEFTMTFVEAGWQEFPTTKISTTEALVSKAQSVLNFLNALFAGRYSLKNLPNWARTAAGTDLSRLFDSTYTLVKQADASGDWLQSFNDARAKAEKSSSDSNKLASYTQTALTPTSSVTASLSTVRRWSVSNNSLLASPGAGTSSTLTGQMAENADAIRQLMRGTLLASGAVLVASASIETYDDAMTTRNALTAAVDNELLTTSDDTTYQAWNDLRSAIYIDLTERARNSARLLDYNPVDVTPALALAYDLYDDAARDLEIVTRNAIKNPNFVTTNTLKVLNA